MKYWFGIFSVGCAVIIVFLFVGKNAQDQPSEVSGTEFQMGKEKKSQDRSEVAEVVVLPVASAVAELHSEAQTPEDDLSTLQVALSSYRKVFGENPVGLNDEVTAALTGQNAKRISIFPRGYSGISENGELLDRWGTPYRFHAISRTQMEIKSAGPDKRFFTGDDVFSIE